MLLVFPSFCYIFLYFSIFFHCSYKFVRRIEAKFWLGAGCIFFLHYVPTPGSMNSLFSGLFTEFWRDVLGGGRHYLGEIWGGF